MFTVLLKEGKSLPSSLTEGYVEVNLIAQQYYQAFGELSNARQYLDGGYPQPLSFEALDRYAIRNGIEREEFDSFIYIMQKVDAEFIMLKGKAIKQELDKVKRKASAEKARYGKRS